MPKQVSQLKAHRSESKLGRFRGHPFIIPVVTFLVLFFIGLVGFIGSGGTTIGASDIRIVSVIIDDKEQVLPTRAKTVADLLKRLEVELDKEDIVSPGLDTPIEDDNLEVHVYNARPVVVVDGDIRKVAYTAEPTGQAVAKAAGIEVFPEDKVITKPAGTPEPDNVLREGVVAEQVVIDRATPAHLNLYGTLVPVRTHARTVGDLLKEKDVKLNEGDTLTPEPDTPLSRDIQVFVVRLGRQIVQVEEAVAPPTEFVDDHNLTLGATVVQDPGKPGKKLVTYEIEQQNGIEVARRVIQEVVAEQPVKRVVARGRRAPVVAGNKAEIMSAAGIPANQHYAADFIISHESGWRVNALNSRGCAGLGQACPGTKLSNVCPNWQSDPVCQMRFFNGYAVGRYGSWSNAMDTWQRQRWW